MFVGDRFRGKWAEALLCHGWMNSYPIPPTGSVPNPSPACSPTVQPLKFSLTFILTLSAQYLQKRITLLSLAWDLLYPETPPNAWSRHVRGNGAAFPKHPFPLSLGRILYSPMQN